MSAVPCNFFPVFFFFWCRRSFLEAVPWFHSLPRLEAIERTLLEFLTTSGPRPSIVVAIGVSFLLLFFVFLRKDFALRKEGSVLGINDDKAAV